MKRCKWYVELESGNCAKEVQDNISCEEHYRKCENCRAYVYYVDLTNQLYESKFKDLQFICIEECPASELFPWIITNVRLSKYASCHLIGEL